jgi:hypothetical protein
MKQPSVWIVEANDFGDGWGPLLGRVGDTRKEARWLKHQLQCDWPGRQFRVARYARVSPSRKQGCLTPYCRGRAIGKDRLGHTRCRPCLEKLT